MTFSKRVSIVFFTCFVSLFSLGIRVDGPDAVRSKLIARTGRQWTGDLAVPTDCSFPVSDQDGTHKQATLAKRGPSGGSFRSSADNVSMCGFTASSPQSDGVYSWQKGLASQSTWLGGPKVDSSNSTTGGYAFFETSSLSVQQLPGIQAKAWLKSPVYQPTAPNGHCLRFAYNMQGVSASQLKLLRVQMIPLEGHSAAPQHRSAPIVVNSILLPTLGGQNQQHQHQELRQQFRSAAEVFAAPWTPFHAVIVNQTGWQEVVDQIWLSSDSTNGEWSTGHVTYSSPYPHAFVFEAVPDVGQLHYRGHVALDDIRFTDGPCPAECEFNSDLCEWTNEADQDDFDWSLSRGSLWTSTGPIRDQLSSAHNFNFGGYAYIDSRQPHFSGSRAVMTSPVLQATDGPNTVGAKCLVFWVHMFGAGIGRLRVLQRATDEPNAAAIGKMSTRAGASKSTTFREIWRLQETGPRDSWYRAQVTLASSSPFQVQLEATVGESGYGDIAVDSFRLEDGPCPGLPEWAVNRGIDCTFQKNSCSWVITNSQPGIVSMWTRVTGDAFANRPEGHSQQNVLPEPNNGYMSFDTFQNVHQAGSRGYVSALLSPSSEKHCLSFWYFMASSTTSQPRLGALEVQLFEPNSTSTNGTLVKRAIVSSTIWRLESHQLEKWQFAQVSFVPERGGYVSFVGIRGKTVRGIIGIDDVTLYKSDCPVWPPEAGVSPLDCAFDSNLCKWTVDTRTFETPAAGNAEKEADSKPTATETLSTSTISSVPTATKREEEIGSSSAIDQSTSSAPATTAAFSTSPSTSRQDEAMEAITEPSVSTAITDDTTTISSVWPDGSSTSDAVTEQTTEGDSMTTTITVEKGSATGSETIESDSIRGKGEVFFLNFPAKSPIPAEEPAVSSTALPTTESPSTESEPTSTSSAKPLVVLSTTASSVRTTAITTAGTTTVTPSPPPTRPSSKLITLINNKSKEPVPVIVGDTVSNKNGISRRVGESYDEVTSLGRNTIEVISTSRDGATKSIIISQPVKTRFRRSADGQWRGYNRDPRIVNLKANEDRSRQHALPIPIWLRPRHKQEGEARGPVVPHSTGAFRPMNPSSRQPFQHEQSANSNRQHVSLTSDEPSHSAAVRNPRWMLAGASSSLHGVQDHTFSLTEGGYVFVETQAGKPSVSRLFSPEFRSDETYCLTFFFTTAYNSPNTTLIVYRESSEVTEELWRVTSAALDRSEQRITSPWIPAQVPVPRAPSSGTQTIVIEGSSDGGAMAIDDIRLRKLTCLGRP